jgi:Cu(I)/Ag(I) efflux system membrane protein CusA/SilA
VPCSLFLWHLLSITLVPVLLGFMVCGRVHWERDNLLNRVLAARYRPLLKGILQVLWLVLALVLTVVGFWPL